MTTFIEFLKIFLVGGFFCAVGQILLEKTKLGTAKILVSFVCTGVLLSAVGVYAKLVDFAGAGATVPIVGFGHALAKGVKEAVEENGWLGVLSGGLKGAAAGIGTAMLCGFLAAVFWKPPKDS